MDATINGNAGTASIGGVSIGKSGSDQVITGLTNKTWTVGTTQAVDGRAATENQLQSVAENLNTANTNIATLQHGFKVQANGESRRCVELHSRGQCESHDDKRLEADYYFCG